MSAIELAGLALDTPFTLPGGGHAGGGHALFTTRATGNLSLAAGDRHEQGLATREELCRSLGLHWLAAGPQVHGTTVRRVRAQEGEGGQPATEPADGQATALGGIGAMVLAADCVPVALAMPGAVSAVHAGWRGLADGVLEEGVRALRELATQDGPLLAIVGPCAGVCCYEVGPEVLARFDLPADRKAKLDMRAIVRSRLLAAGVAQVLDLDVCTICDERMFSHRREGSAAGRQAAIAWLS